MDSWAWLEFLHQLGQVSWRVGLMRNNRKNRLAIRNHSTNLARQIKWAREARQRIPETDCK